MRIVYGPGGDGLYSVFMPFFITDSKDRSAAAALLYNLFNGSLFNPGFNPGFRRACNNYVNVITSNTGMSKGSFCFFVFL